MKYLVMVQGSQADYDAQSGKGSAGSPVWDEKAVQAMYAHMGSINDDLSESGELVTGYGLRAPASGRAGGVDAHGRPLLAGGPLNPTNEKLAGVWIHPIG
ncbi:hypothetical protein, partial [Streptomyces rubiginosohelvolus]|uniref:hypothetical protein n=1 Tax=Streptomyces rubiginosohelvolus TaxID=67362 RepID=UPI00367CB827